MIGLAVNEGKNVDIGADKPTKVEEMASGNGKIVPKIFSDEQCQPTEEPQCEKNHVIDVSNNENEIQINATNAQTTMTTEAGNEMATVKDKEVVKSASVLQPNGKRRPSRDYSNSISSIFTIRPRRPSA